MCFRPCVLLSGVVGSLICPAWDVTPPFVQSVHAVDAALLLLADGHPAISHCLCSGVRERGVENKGVP